MFGKSSAPSAKARLSLGYKPMEVIAQTRLLMIDDDEKLCRLVRAYLEPFGYALETEHTGPAGLARAMAEPFNAILLDVMLPGMSGFEVLQQLRRKSQVPVLMLTALGDETDRIAGLESGADDYLPKTFSTRELLARLRAVLRQPLLDLHADAGGEADEQLLHRFRAGFRVRGKSKQQEHETSAVSSREQC